MKIAHKEYKAISEARNETRKSTEKNERRETDLRTERGAYSDSKLNKSFILLGRKPLYKCLGI